MSSLIPREDGRDDDDAAGGVVNPAADFGDDDVGNKAENNRNGSSGRGSSCVATPPAKQLEELSTMEREALRERVHAAELKKCADFVRIEVRYTKDAFRRLFQAQEVLEQLFKLFDHDRRGLLLQEDWIEFLKQRLTNEKEIDFAEQLESVAYCRCGEEAIKPDQFIQIFNTKGIIDKLYRLIDRENLGTVSSKQIMDFLASISNTSPRAGFDKGSLEWLEKLFRQTVGDEKEIRREDFKKIVISKNPFFTERVFQIFDKDNSGTISLQEFLDSMHQFAGQSPDDKIRFLFKVYDIDGDGLIQLKELQDVIRACMEENGMQFSEEQISDLTMALFEDADPNHKGTITYEALKNQLEKHGGLLENLSISIDRWLVPPKPKPKRSLFRKLMNWRPYYLSKPYVKNNYVYLVFLGCFLLVNLVLFVTRSMQYKDSNYYVIFARACGQCLNFNCMFILVLMLRQCITFLRTRGFGAFLPLDHHIYLHKFTGILIFAYSFLHTIMHLLNFSLIVTYSKEFNNYDETNNTMHFTTLEWIFTTKPRLFGLVPGYANPTGVILVIILIVMFFCSQSCVRRGGSFEIFYWTHLLYVPFWILLILHGPKFWIWFLIPGIIYLLERTYRIIETKSQRGKTYISSGLLLPSKVTHLVIKRPPTFDFHAGDYVFVNIPAIAKYEWHPFTISSAPEQEDYLWLHIRGVGEWTNRLYEYFESEQVRLNEGELTGLCARQPSVRGSEGPVQRLKTTITRTFSNKDGSKKQDVQLLAYHTENQQQQQKNEEGDATESDGEISGVHPCSSKTSYQELSKKMSQERRLQRILFPNEKAKLEKSISMPDIQTRAKKKERLKYIRDYVRSESERNFSECQIKQARLKSFYSSPQNKSLAISFRYMRKKPPIIAFKTPSMEDCGSQMSSPGASSRPLLPENQAEEGRVGQEFFPGKSTASSVEKNSGYPIGKPLEPIMEMAIRKVNNDYGNDDDVDDEELEQLRELLEANVPKGPEIYLDGPYGAPSSHIFRAQHAVLIATGIGVTPFASILQSIMFRYWKARQTCPKCNYSWASELSVMKLQKVDFFWINRDQKSFEWFVNLLSQLEIEQAELGGAMERFLEMHMYITSALQKTDMKAVGLQLALDLLHEKEKRDLITGLKTRTNAGRPNWDKVFDQLDNQGKGKVTVFYCGPPQLGRILRVKCDQHNFIFRKETF